MAARRSYVDVFLKKQINPHFLFNVLNNIGILAADEPFEASAMLAELRRLIEYQLRHASDSETTVESCRRDRVGGLGIANTLRRLELFYGLEFSYLSRASASVYSVVLRIPCLRT